jgi:thiamine-phosphate pyrophosphorylase
MTNSSCRLYLVSPPQIDVEHFSEDLRAALDGGDVGCLQLRLKHCEDIDILRAAESLAPICREYEVPLLINDRPDLAKSSDADGVHIGQKDASYKEARNALDSDRTIGVTCHNSRHLAVTAAECGADYVAFGAFFETNTKAPETRATTEILEWVNEVLLVPSVAIGGITPANCSPLVRAGANFLAVVSAVWNHKDGPRAGVAEFNQAIAVASEIQKSDNPG